MEAKLRQLGQSPMVRSPSPPNPAAPGPDPDRARFVDAVMTNPIVRAILQLAPRLELPDWWLTGGALFQTVWNVLDDRQPTRGINDYDLFYFDPGDLSWKAEDVVIKRGAELFGTLGAEVEIRNEARVHLWFEEHFGRSAPPFTSSHDAIDHFAAFTCCYGITADTTGNLEVYAPFGYRDLFARRVHPNPVLATRDVYEAKSTRWQSEWPSLSVEPWPDLPEAE